ncbi:MAG: hypothetical protein JSV89_08970 [Spirochaetaceae bacterium]|nr:MAG: hypothetical protein JSV89_08970 [Spirochaetaceae bacterium]
MIASRRTKPSLIVVFWLIAVFGFTQTYGPERQALKDVKSSWTQELLYEQVLVSPQALCYDSGRKLYIYEYSRNMLYRMDAGGELSEVTSTGSATLRTIAWQPGKKRLVGFDSHGMYELLPGRFRKLKELNRSFMISTVAIDPTDDSIFAGHDTKGRPIVHLDADGGLIEIVRRNAQGCSQLVFDDRRSILYFSETFSGSISSLDLSSKRVDVLVRDIGIPGTEEPVMIWMDGKYTLWFSTANDGIYRYGNGGFQQIAPPTMGAGPVVWSPIYDNLVAIQYVGSNLVTYDFQHKEAVDITPHLNAFDIVEDSSGRVFYPRFEFIFMLSEGKIVRFSEQLPDVCLGIEIDQQGYLYAALQDGGIYRIPPSGKVILWKAG